MESTWNFPSADGGNYGQFAWKRMAEQEADSHR